MFEDNERTSRRGAVAQKNFITWTLTLYIMQSFKSLDMGHDLLAVLIMFVQTIEHCLAYRKILLSVIPFKAWNKTDHLVE